MNGYFYYIKKIEEKQEHFPQQICFLCGNEIKSCEESLLYFWDNEENMFLLHKECKPKLREYERKQM